jgi:acylphosphatase
VQAVGFRASCLRRAVDAGLAGWVRNTAGGDVEAVFEGPPAAVDALVAWCHAGPPTAHVSRVEVADESPRGDIGFVIR